MENPNQVGEQCLPDTELKLVQEVNDHHPGNIKFLPRLFESFAEGILCCAESNRESAVWGDFAYNNWYGGSRFEQIVNTSACDSVT
jgi:hypothetical protein